MHHSRLLTPAAVLLGLALTAPVVQAQTFTNQTVNATANLLGAGRSGTDATPAPAGSGGGTAAPTFTLLAGTNRILTFSSVTGNISYDGSTFNDPDGVGNGNTLNVSAWQGISGITYAGHAGFLTGVFINGAPSGFAAGSSGSSAASLTYTTSLVANTTFSPLLNQAFFIGDGKTGDGSGTIQQFLVPDNATALVLGYEDAPSYQGNPGAYSDNTGSVLASFAITGSAAPEPGSLALLAIPGIAAIGGVLSRRR